VENPFQEFIESRSLDFNTTGINIFLIGKNVFIVLVLILIDKTVFEPQGPTRSIQVLWLALILHCWLKEEKRKS